MGIFIVIRVCITSHKDSLRNKRWTGLLRHRKKSKLAEGGDGGSENVEEERALAEPFHNSLGIATMGNNGTNQVENEHNLAPRATTATPPYSSSVDSAGGASRRAILSQAISLAYLVPLHLVVLDRLRQPMSLKKMMYPFCALRAIVWW